MSGPYHMEAEHLIEKDEAIRTLRDALETFVAQWNACGPNSDFGRYFQNVRDKAVAALANTEN